MHALRASQTFPTPSRKQLVLAFRIMDPTTNNESSKTEDRDESGSATTAAALNAKCKAEPSGTPRKVDSDCFPRSKNCHKAKVKNHCRGDGYDYDNVHVRTQQKQRHVDRKTPVHYHHQESPEVATKLSLDVTGFTLRDICIEMNDAGHDCYCILSISGKRTNKLGDDFSFDRRFRLDKTTADLERVSATVEDGILEIVVPKKKKTTVVGPRRIPIYSTTTTTRAASATTSTGTGTLEKDEDGTTASVEIKPPFNDMLQPPPHVIKEEESSNPGEQEQNERDSVEVETVHEDDGEENEEQQEEEPMISLTTATTNSKNPSTSATDEESWMEVLA